MEAWLELELLRVDSVEDLREKVLMGFISNSSAEGRSALMRSVESAVNNRNTWSRSNIFPSVRLDYALFIKTNYIYCGSPRPSAPLSTASTLQWT